MTSQTISLQLTGGRLLFMFLSTFPTMALLIRPLLFQNLQFGNRPTSNYEGLREKRRDSFYDLYLQNNK